MATGYTQGQEDGIHPDSSAANVGVVVPSRINICISVPATAPARCPSVYVVVPATSPSPASKSSPFRDL